MFFARDYKLAKKLRQWCMQRITLLLNLEKRNRTR